MNANHPLEILFFLKNCCVNFQELMRQCWIQHRMSSWKFTQQEDGVAMPWCAPQHCDWLPCLGAGHMEAQITSGPHANGAQATTSGYDVPVIHIAGHENITVQGNQCSTPTCVCNKHACARVCVRLCVCACLRMVVYALCLGVRVCARVYVSDWLSKSNRMSGCMWVSVGVCSCLRVYAFFVVLTYRCWCIHSCILENGRL